MLTEQIKESKNVISNEYEYSTNLLNCQSEFNQEIQKTGPNEAERRAKIEEKKRMEKEAQKKREYNNNMNKYMTNIRMHKYKEEQKNGIIQYKCEGYIYNNIPLTINKFDYKIRSNK